MFVGSVSDYTFIQPGQRVSVGNFPATNPRWSRILRLTNQAVFCLRIGAGIVAITVDAIVAIAATLELALTWAPKMSVHPANAAIVDPDGSTKYADFTLTAVSELSAMSYVWKESQAGVTYGSALTTTGIYDVGTAASGTLTSDQTRPADGATIRIGNKTYTFKTTLTPTEGEVFISNTGGDEATKADNTLLNLIRAINHTGTPNTDYKCAAVHTQVTAAASVTSHAFAVTAIASGTGPNAYITLSSSAHLSWGAGTLASGAAGAAGDGMLRITPTNGSVAKNGYYYQCTIANDSGSTTSNAGILTVTVT